jgi:hypothetical protein
MDKIQGFRGKFKLWLHRIVSVSTEMFPTVCSLAAGSKLICVTEDLLMHCSISFRTILKRVWQISTGFVIRSVFLQHFFLKKLTDLKADRTVKFKFCELSLDTFWLSVKEEYPVISGMDLRIFNFRQRIYVKWGFRRWRK